MLTYLSNNNIFDNDLYDSIFYCVCYNVIPVITTICTLHVTTNDSLYFAYAYFSIFINTISCIYDNITRIRKAKSVTKRKLLLFHVAMTLIISIYSLTVLINILITKNVLSCNWILFVYIIPFCISSICLLITINKHISTLDEMGDLK